MGFTIQILIGLIICLLILIYIPYIAFIGVTALILSVVIWKITLFGFRFGSPALIVPMVSIVLLFLAYLAKRYVQTMLADPRQVWLNNRLRIEWNKQIASAKKGWEYLYLLCVWIMFCGIFAFLSGLVLNVIMEFLSKLQILPSDIIKSAKVTNLITIISVIIGAGISLINLKKLAHEVKNQGTKIPDSKRADVDNSTITNNDK